jgi:hypothetical protein
MVSPGGTDESVLTYLLRNNVTYQQLNAINGATGGLAEEGELTTACITPIEDAISALSATGVASMTAILSLLLYRVHCSTL